jgi:protein-S-isoprenylcysteine O-methyltransferase Ste14
MRLQLEYTPQTSKCNDSADLTSGCLPAVSFANVRPDVERKRKVIPPVYLLLTLAAMVALHFTLPVARLISAPYSHAGWLLVLGGLAIAMIASNAFRRAGTPVVPFERSTVLVTDGLFRYTRNPMYLGLVILLLGIAIALGSLSAFLPIPVFVWIIQKWFIQGEERFLTEIFGEQYLAYQRRVRRWI